MARNFKYSLPAFLAPSIISVTGEKTDWPSTNVLLDEVPKRPWKTSVKTANQDIIFDFGSATVVKAILLRWVNYDRVQFAYSSDNVSYSGITPSGYTIDGNGLSVDKEEDIDRRQILVDTTGIFNHRYLRMRIPANRTTDDGASYYSSGAITFGADLVQMPDWMSAPFSITVLHPALVKEFPVGAKQVNQHPDKRIIWEWGGQFVDSHVRSHVRAIDKIGLRPMIVFPNIREGDQALSAFNPARAYLVRRIGDANRTYPELPEWFNKTFTFEEVI